VTRIAVTSLLLVAAALAFTPLVSLAEDSPNPCGADTVTSGSGDVVVEGKQRRVPATPPAAPSCRARPTSSCYRQLK